MTTKNWRWPVTALAAGGLASAFMQTLVIPIQPRLPQLLNASGSDASWVVTITLLSATVSTPIAGRLADMYGKRRVILILLAVMLTGSVISAFATSLLPMLLGRALQGMVLGIIPIGIAVLRDIVPPHNLGGAIAFMSATIAIGAALGLPLSALVVQYADWHNLFWVSAALASLTIVGVLLTVPNIGYASGGKFDGSGAFGLVLGLVAVLMALSQGAIWGWGAPATLASGIGGLVVLILWGRYELHVLSPLVDLRVTASRPVLMTNLAAIAMGFALLGSNVALPQLLQIPRESGAGLGQSLLDTSLVLMPSGIAVMLTAPIAGHIIRVHGPRTLLILGAIILATGYGLGLVLMHEPWQVLIVSVLIGVGIGLGYGAMPAIIMAAVPAAESAAANGVNSLMRFLGTSIAAAAVGGVLAATSRPFNGSGLPTETGFHVTFLVGLLAALLAAGFGLVVPRVRPSGQNGDRESPAALTEAKARDNG